MIEQKNKSFPVERNSKRIADSRGPRVVKIKEVGILGSRRFWRSHVVLQGVQTAMTSLP
jgi:hypothetical protein